MTLPQRSRNDQRQDRSTHIAHKIRAAAERRNKRALENALRGKDLDALSDDLWHDHHLTEDEL